MKILKKNSAYIIEIEQSEKETGRTMYNTRHELAKLITHKERLQSNWNSLKEYLEWEINDYNGDIDIETRNIDSEFLRGIAWEAQELLDKMNELEGVDNENN